MKYPDDMEARAVLALTSMGDSRYGAELMIREILAKQPDHPAGHHYRIHNWDYHEPEQALESARLGSPLQPRRILVPLDFSTPSLKALRYAVPFAQQFGAALYLVSVLEPASFLHGLENLSLAIPEPNDGEARCAGRLLPRRK